MLTIERVIADFGPALARVATSYERNPALRDELLQEIVLAIHRALPSLQEPSKLKPFVFRVAHNRCVSHVMVRAAAPAHEPPAEDLVSEEPTPEQTVLADERSRRLVGAVRALPLPHRQVITLLLEDLSYAEIADALGISPSNVGVRVNRAKAQLKERLDHG